MLCEHEQPRDLARAMSTRVSNMFLRHTPWFSGCGRVLCNGVSTAQRLHQDAEDSDGFM